MRFMSISLAETDLRPLLLCNEFDINNIVMVHNDDAKWWFVSREDIVFLISWGISKIVGMIFTPYGWGQKFTLNNPMEHLLDLFKFFPEALEGQDSQFSPFFHGLSLKRQSALGTLRGSDTFNLHQASTLRSKGIHRHPYCMVLSLKRRNALVTFGDLWRVLGGPDTVRDHQGLILRSKGTI